MPIFEYQCAACGDRFEEFEAAGGRTPARCPRCGARDVKKLLSVFAVTRPSTPPDPPFRAGARGPCGSADCACQES
jgi:putative FmdB family regulatory protein